MNIEKTKSRITVRQTSSGVNVYLRYRGEDAWPMLNKIYEKYKGQEITLKTSYDNELPVL